MARCWSLNYRSWIVVDKSRYRKLRALHQQQCKIPKRVPLLSAGNFQTWDCVQVAGVSMKHLLLLAVALVAVATSLGAQESASQGKTEQKFHSGSLVRIRVSAGGYTISGTDSDAIVVNCDQASRARVRIKTSDSGADVSITDTPHGNFHASIEVPRRSDLWVRLSAGELKIENVEGNKDVESAAGDVYIEVPRPEDYGHRDASVTAGDLDASAFEVSKGGLFRSFQQEGKGKYRLHAHVGAGNLTLRPAN